VANLRERAQRIAKGLANDALKRRPVELRHAELQRAVENQFPLRRESLVPLEFSDPFIRLDVGEDLMGLELSISAKVLGAATPATRWLLVGKLNYERDSGWFILCDPSLQYLKARANTENATIRNLVRKFLSPDVISSVISDVRIYQLNTADMKQALVRKYLHSIRVSDGKVAICLHFD
jgi:hypothetical protein